MMKRKHGRDDVLHAHHGDKATQRLLLLRVVFSVSLLFIIAA
jgi:hypothetical protein